MRRHRPRTSCRVRRGRIATVGTVDKSEGMTRPDSVRTETWVVTGGRASEPGSPLNAPLVAASNFVLGGERAYVRDQGTDTIDAFEQLAGGLEQAAAVSFSSGMAAIAAVFDLVPVGARIVWPDDCYQGVVGLVEAGERTGRWTSTRLAVEDTDAWCAAAADCDLLWLESPSNPLLIVADLHRIGAAGRPPGALMVVDNTLATPLVQRPLDLGADISIQSATKHLGGHSDLLSGVATTRDPDLAHRLHEQRELRGAMPGALESFLVTRGMRTLGLRFAAAQASAGVIAARLEQHPAVERVRYPGLASHPTHRIAAEQMAGFGTMIAFDVSGGARRADALCSALRTIRHATSFGAVESTIERRAAVSRQDHLPPGLLRLSIGIEHVDDLWADLEESLEISGRLA